ncbi:segregation and condensation protein A [Psychrilyobacter atlanticus]|uniref:segregation and condensation protein A n=1 Tax=Psychrilyobacter atlanticus TaxID=271091 RepID=UPI0004025CB6|nr:ScpA family protein [Psychrilyobacter atlanticus]
MKIEIKLENFEGPLDLLLHLLEKKEMKITEVKISTLIDEYLSLIEDARRESVSIKVEFLGVASELLEIKALSILNMREKEKKEEALSQKLAEYKLFKELSEKIRELENEYNISYTKFSKGKNIIKVPNTDFDLSNLSGNLIFNIYSKYIKNTDVYEIDIEVKYDLKEEKNKLWKSIPAGREVYLEDIFSKAVDRLHLVYLFLSLLELYRDDDIEILEHGIKLKTPCEVI